MVLRPEDIRDVQFGVTHVRGGYDMAEVDAFLVQVEATVDQLTRELQRAADLEAVLRTENNRLQARVAYLEQVTGSDPGNP